MAMGHVILKEFYVDREVPYFADYARRLTDLPLMVTLREWSDGEGTTTCPTGYCVRRTCWTPAASRRTPSGRRS
jgi:nitrate reductase alpha subunit